jgi:hypothetical protein
VRDAPAVAADAAGQPEALARLRTQRVEQRERERQQARAPPGVRVLHAVVRLHGIGPALDARGARFQQVGCHLGVGVHDHDGVGEPLRAAPREREGERVALAAHVRLEAREHGRARGASDRGGLVAAVVRDDHHAEPVARPVQCVEAREAAADNARLVVRRHQHVEAQGARRTRRRREPPRAQREHEQVDAHGERGQRQEHQDEVRRRVHRYAYSR